MAQPSATAIPYAGGTMQHGRSHPLRPDRRNASTVAVARRRSHWPRSFAASEAKGKKRQQLGYLSNAAFLLKVPDRVHRPCFGTSNRWAPVVYSTNTSSRRRRIFGSAATTRR